MKTLNPYFDPIGDRELCAWMVAPGVCSIQTRQPRHARRLSQRTDTRLVARDHAGGYLRIFEMPRPIAFVEQLINRYTAKQTATNEAIPLLAVDSGEDLATSLAVMGKCKPQRSKTGKEVQNA